MTYLCLIKCYIQYPGDCSFYGIAELTSTCVYDVFSILNCILQ